MTTIVNLYGGPGTGKSTSAAFLYYLLKTQGHNAELVREYVKGWAWEGRSFGDFDQLYFLGKQSRNESMLYGKADWIVTDSPVLMNAYYAGLHCPPLAAGVKAAVLGFYRHAADKGHRHVHVFLKRSKPYNPAGRYQGEAEAKQMDGKLRRELQRLNVKLIDCDTEEEPLRQMLAGLMGNNSVDPDDGPCEDCGTLEGVTFAACPYASDIRGDETPHHLCGSCRRDRAADI